MKNSIDIINIVIESEECNGKELLLNLIECEMEKEAIYLIKNKNIDLNKNDDFGLFVIFRAIISNMDELSTELIKK